VVSGLKKSKSFKSVAVNNTKSGSDNLVYENYFDEQDE
jgi:hypothetical protein